MLFFLRLPFIYHYNLTTGVSQVVNIKTDGTPSEMVIGQIGHGNYIDMSDDGSFVIFQSEPEMVQTGHTFSYESDLLDNVSGLSQVISFLFEIWVFPRVCQHH